jgi:hypothetical protein
MRMCSILLSGLLLSLFYDPEDRGCAFHANFIDSYKLRDATYKRLLFIVATVSGLESREYRLRDPSR